MKLYDGMNKKCVISKANVFQDDGNMSEQMHRRTVTCFCLQLEWSKFMFETDKVERGMNNG